MARGERGSGHGGLLGAGRGRPPPQRGEGGKPLLRGLRAALLLAGAAAGRGEPGDEPLPGAEGRAEPVAYLRSQLSPAALRGRLKPWDVELRGGSPGGSP